MSLEKRKMLAGPGISEQDGEVIRSMRPDCGHSPKILALSLQDRATIYESLFDKCPYLFTMEGVEVDKLLQMMAGWLRTSLQQLQFGDVAFITNTSSETGGLA